MIALTNQVEEKIDINKEENIAKTKLDIMDGRVALGIEFGSTRIKAVLVGADLIPIATGTFDWENIFENGIWTYSLEDIWKGLRVSYRKMATEVFDKYGETLTVIGSIGFSAMMHGYMAFDKDGKLLVPFRTWRNSITEEASYKLTEALQFNIPQRWSIAHLYQAILNQEEHVGTINYLTTLAGYIHWQVSGKKVLGIGDASGMFPIDSDMKDYDQEMIKKFTKLTAETSFSQDLRQILPKVLIAGEDAGTLTQEGAYLLDPTGNLKPGIILCPPEGDAGTGMVATNSVRPRTGNISAGTSTFAMIVLEEKLKKIYPEIDIVATPVGDPVAMVHANNCSTEINAWINLFKEFSETLGLDISFEKLYSALFNKSLEGSPDCGGMLSYGYYSGENITGIKEGRPLFVRTSDSQFNLANFMRLHLTSAFGAISIGMEIIKKEGICIDKLVGHGGILKTPEVGQRILAAAMGAPIVVMDTASEGGAWGIALLAVYQLVAKKFSLEKFLEKKVFTTSEGTTIEPKEEDLRGYKQFIERYKKGLPIEAEAINGL